MKSDKEKISDVEYFLNSISKLWKLKANISWNEFYKDKNYKRISLPKYPFEKQEYKLDFNFSKDKAEKEEDISNWFYLPIWKYCIHLALHLTKLFLKNFLHHSPHHTK